MTGQRGSGGKKNAKPTFRPKARQQTQMEVSGLSSRPSVREPPPHPSTAARERGRERRAEGEVTVQLHGSFSQPPGEVRELEPPLRDVLTGAATA